MLVCPLLHVHFLFYEDKWERTWGYGEYQWEPRDQKQWLGITWLSPSFLVIWDIHFYAHSIHVIICFLFCLAAGFSRINKRSKYILCQLSHIHISLHKCLQMKVLFASPWYIYHILTISGILSWQLSLLIVACCFWIKLTTQTDHLHNCRTSSQLPTERAQEKVTLFLSPWRKPVGFVRIDRRTFFKNFTNHVLFPVLISFWRAYYALELWLFPCRWLWFQLTWI